MIKNQSEHAFYRMKFTQVGSQGSYNRSIVYSLISELLKSRVLLEKNVGCVDNYNVANELFENRFTTKCHVEILLCSFIYNNHYYSC